MELFGEAVAHGAATIVSALGTGLGAAFGIGLTTKAKVELIERFPTIEGKIFPEEAESTALIEAAVRAVLRLYGLEEDLGARVEVFSNIPIARGLKSSSAAANALVLATSAALGKTLEDSRALQLSVEASLQAGVTVTGAFDDCCASYYGGIFVTDNTRRRILKRLDFDAEYGVAIYVPETKVYTSAVNTENLRALAPLLEVAINDALNSKHWRAMTLNGLIQSAALGYDATTALAAIKAGAVAAGISGKGPSVVAVAAKERLKYIVNAWRRLKLEGKIMETTVNSEKAHVVRE